MRGRSGSKLVPRFAVSSLVVFMAIGSLLAVVVSREVRAREEETAKFHAVFVTDSILRYELRPTDVRAPMDVKGNLYQGLLDLVRARILQPPVVRVKIWRQDGTIVFSDEPRLVGKKFEVDDTLTSAFAGTPADEISDLKAAENIFEAGSYSKLFSTYVPLYLGQNTKKPAAVAEVYTDYAGIQARVDRLFKTLSAALLGALAALYIILLPIMRRISRTVSVQNVALGQQTRKLEAALKSERGTVTQLREVNKMKDQFVAVASHELRTPLTSIIGYAKTLRRPAFAEDPAAREEFLEAIERQGDRLFRLVSNLLAASHIEDESSRVSVSSFSFPDIAREVLDGLGARADRVKLKLDDDPRLILSDPQRIHLILANLLDNALKFSPGAKKCELGSLRAADSYSFWVCDRGIGIPADQREQIFDRFYQVDSSITRQYGGVGLGLNLVKETVDSLGGRIEVESEEGKGSTFTVILPLFRGGAAEGNGHGTNQADSQQAFVRI
jgi:signal transduction histidine kinase